MLRFIVGIGQQCDGTRFVWRVVKPWSEDNVAWCSFFAFSELELRQPRDVVFHVSDEWRHHRIDECDIGWGRDGCVIFEHDGQGGEDRALGDVMGIGDQCDGTRIIRRVVKPWGKDNVGGDGFDTV